MSVGASLIRAVDPVWALAAEHGYLGGSRMPAGNGTRNSRDGSCAAGIPAR